MNERKGTGGRPTRKDAEARNARILQVATDLFLSKGFSATSLNDIAVTAGVAKRTIYDWYGDKAAIFAEIIRSDAARIDPGTIAITNQPNSAHTALVQLARHMRDVLLDPLTSSILRLMAGESRAFSELIAQNSVEGMQAMYSIVERFLIALRERGALDFSCDVRLLAMRFFDCVIGVSSLRKIMEEDFAGWDDEELAERVKMFLAYLQLSSVPDRAETALPKNRQLAGAIKAPEQA